MMQIAVIVTTYNRPEALEAVLEAYAEQSDSGFEVLVADDGSTRETAEVVTRIARRAPWPCRHVWHEDVGFRAAAIRNKAVGASGADYVIFTDGDCIPSRTFVARHRALAEKGWFVAGNRVLLSDAFTQRILAEHLPVHRWGRARWAGAWLCRDVNRVAPLLALGDGPWRKRDAGRWEGVKTCNLAVWRADLVRVNGLDEAYTGWGMEDSDLVVRLLHAGVRHKNGRFATPVFHLWHRENDRSRLAHNQAQLRDLVRSDRVRARAGLDQHA
ncbi:MAG: glycosyltransferase [Betaproteobacteria bacterium]|nr:glycosyltransferase [Betaproteobacteria bacterium]